MTNSPIAARSVGQWLRQTFRRSDRLTCSYEFEKVQASGRRHHTRHFVILRAPAEGYDPRLGLIVSRRVGSAVCRNRVKRVVRTVFRQCRDMFGPHCDVVVIAKPGASTLDYDAVLAEFREALAPRIAAAS